MRVIAASMPISAIHPAYASDHSCYSADFLPPLPRRERAGVRVIAASIPISAIHPAYASGHSCYSADFLPLSLDGRGLG